MALWEQISVVLYGILNILVLIKGIHEVKDKRNVYGLAGQNSFLGIFVWGDAIVFGPFWILTSALVLFLQDWYLFLLVFSIFWSVRSFGEVIYWLNEQFAGKNRNPPHTLKFYKFFNNDSIWFIYQIYWQCILVVSLIASIYLSALWLNTKF